jgi:hypothetical protein
MVRDLAASELNWRLVRGANALMAEGTPVTFFYEDPLPPCLAPQGPALPAVDAWGCRLPLVATSLSTARKLAGFPAARRRLFYLWDLEWLRMRERPFHALHAVYGDGRLELVCRCEDHRKLVEDVWCRPVAAVVPDADIRELLKSC